MTSKERIDQLKEEKSARHEHLAQREQVITRLVQCVEERLGTDSQNSHMSSSSDLCVQKHRSLRMQYGNKPGGHEGHPGQRVYCSSAPDEVRVPGIERCQYGLVDLHAGSVRPYERSAGGRCPMAWRSLPDTF
jgi:hypothetical protein